MWAKVMAGLALFAIVAGIVGTWILFIVSTISNPEPEGLSEAELQEIISSYSGSQDITIEEVTLTGSTEGQ